MVLGPGSPATLTKRQALEIFLIIPHQPLSILCSLVPLSFVVSQGMPVEFRFLKQLTNGKTCSICRPAIEKIPIMLQLVGRPQTGGELPFRACWLPTCLLPSHLVMSYSSSTGNTNATFSVAFLDLCVRNSCENSTHDLIWHCTYLYYVAILR